MEQELFLTSKIKMWNKW